MPADSPPPVVPTVVGFEHPQEKEKISKAPVGIPEAVASPTDRSEQASNAMAALRKCQKTIANASCDIRNEPKDSPITLDQTDRGPERPRRLADAPRTGTDPTPADLYASPVDTAGSQPFLGTSATSRIEVERVSSWKCGRR